MDDKPLWKKQRREILEELISTNFHDYDLFSIPTNAVRSHQRKDVSELPSEQQEAVLFEDFLAVCRGTNGPYIQCMHTDDERIAWKWASEQYKRENPSLCNWMECCFEMGTSLFELQQIISNLRNDFTRGPVVYTFCSLVLHHLRKTVFTRLDELSRMEEARNLLTLKRHCNELNGRIVAPLQNMAKQIKQNDIIGGEMINFLFEQKERTECYHITGLIADIISMALIRYNQIIFEWISQCTLSSDLAHEFFIWDLRKQRIIDRGNFGRTDDSEDLVDWTDFDNNFVKVPALLPEDYRHISKQITNLGRYLYTMKQQHAELAHLCTQYLLNPDCFKNKSLGDFCAIIDVFYRQCSENILAHFKQRYDIVNFAKQLPNFFASVDSVWIYEFAELFENNKIANMGVEEAEKQFPQLLREAFQSNWLHSSPFHANFEVRISPFLMGNEHFEELKPDEGTFPNLELHIVGHDSALHLAFPARVIEPYRKIFYHLFLLNRAKYLIHRKFHMRNAIRSLEELATVHLFIRFLNVYQEYICGVASKGYLQFSRKLDAVRTLDELVDVQQDFVNEMMEQMKLDQDYLQLKQWIAELANTFCHYALELITFAKLHYEASRLVCKIKKFMLVNRRHVGLLREILFGCYFSAIGDTAFQEEPIWRLLLHVDDATGIAAVVRH